MKTHNFSSHKSDIIHEKKGKKSTFDERTVLHELKHFFTGSGSVKRFHSSQYPF
jgi:hypothetical protein